MSRELNKIFDVKSREAQRAILDKFDITASDKNEVLNKIALNGGGGSEIKHRYYKLTISPTESSFGEAFSYLSPAMGTFKLSVNNRYTFKTYVAFMTGNAGDATLEDMVAFEFIPVTEGHIYTEFRLAKDLKDYQYLYSLTNSSMASKMDAIINNVIEITEEEYYNF